MSGGKILGGSSTINLLIYVRGIRQDFDRWELEGARGWGYDDVFPYFLKLENNLNATLAATGIIQL